MSDQKLKLKSAGVFVDAADIDIASADIDVTLANVWTDDSRSEIAVSVDRVLFDKLVDVAARYLEPQGYSLNLENLLATIDSMRLGVFARVSSKTAGDGRSIAKKLMPQVYMHLPRKNMVGPLLQRFYDEIGKYERELARLQDAEAKSKKSIESAIKDESGKKAVHLLQQENSALREELARLGKKLAAVEHQFKMDAPQAADNQLPSGVRTCVVRTVRVSDGVAVVKVGDSQFSVALKAIGGLPAANARALGHFEGGVIRGLWVFDPVPVPFAVSVATVMAIEGKRVKLRFPNRCERVVPVQAEAAGIKPGTMILARFAGVYMVDMTVTADAGAEIAADIIFDEQTKRQIADMFERGAA